MRFFAFAERSSRSSYDGRSLSEALELNITSQVIVGAAPFGLPSRHGKTICIEIDDRGLNGHKLLYGRKLHYGGQATLQSRPALYHDDRDPRWNQNSLSGLGHRPTDLLRGALDNVFRLVGCLGDGSFETGMALCDI